ncbi:MAG: hypothetical protein JW720_11450 [Sedimentisphaerales bacterium]|nr:hypothetical protein [Sedimentisphaerales bacterium]
MGVTLDGQILFGEHQPDLEAGSFSRDSMELVVPGLDGVLSIDLGGRGRRIRQKGVLRAASRAQLQAKVEAVSAFMDGGTHVLGAGDGREFCDVRVDSLELSNERTGGGGVSIDYEITYMQLKAQ